MKGKRTGIDFSKHEVTIKKTEDFITYTIKIPDSFYERVEFININGILAIHGDFGNYIVCREFHPGPKEGVSERYWCEKIRTYSQQVISHYDSESTKKLLEERLSDYKLECYENRKEYKEEIIEYYEECLDLVHDEIEYVAYAYRNLPTGWDYEDVVYDKDLNIQLKCVFDAFDEICRRMKENEEIRYI